MFNILCGLRWVALIWAVLLAFGGGTAFAEEEKKKPVDPELLEKIRKSNAECFECHSQAGLANPPRTGMDMKKLGQLLVEDKQFRLSAHGEMECKTCHGPGYAKFEHDKDARDQISPCSECHASKVMKVEKQYHASVHAKNLSEKLTCTSCHDAHLFNVAAKMSNPKSVVAQDNAMCLDCHESEERFRAMAPADKKRPDLDRIHSWLPNTRAHWGGVRCIECHTPVSTKMQSHELVNKDKATRDCIACHSRDTALKTRLYRHVVANEQERFGFANSVILANSYVVGATSNKYVDWAILGLAGATLAGVLGHGFLRILLALFRRRGKK